MEAVYSLTVRYERILILLALDIHKALRASIIEFTLLKSNILKI